MGKKPKEDYSCVKVLPCLVNGDSGNQNIYDSFHNASMIFDQMKMVKNESNNIQFITNVFLSAPYKCALKKSIQRMISNQDNRYLIISICTVLVSKVDLEHFALVINSCTDLKYGVSVLTILQSKIFEKLREFWQNCLVKLNTSLTTSAMMKQRDLEIHDFSQACIFVLSKCGETKLGSSSVLKILEVLQHEQLGIETKNNFGIAFVVCLKKSFGGIRYQEILLQIILDRPMILNSGNFEVRIPKFNSNSNKIAIISGLLNACEVEELNKLISDEYLSILTPNYNCEPAYLSYIIGRFLMEISRAAYCLNTEELVMVSRNVLLISRKYLPKLQLSDLPAYIKLLLEVVSSDIEHTVDTIRHQAKTTLVNTVRAVNGDPSLIAIIMEHIFKLEDNCKSTFYACLTILSQEASSSNMIDPKIGEKLLLELYDDSIYSSQIRNTYVGLMKHSKLKLETWKNVWFNPILENILTNKSNLQENTFLLSEVIKIKPELCKCLIENFEKMENLEILLLWLKTLKTERKWHDLVSINDLKKASVSANPKVRISVIEVLAESDKSTAEFTEEDFELIIYFLDMNINCVSPSDRQQICASVKKIFARVKSSYSILERNVSGLKIKLHEANDTRGMKELVRKLERDVELMKIYEEFMLDVRILLLERHIYVGANYYRRHTALLMYKEFQLNLAGFIGCRGLSEDHVKSLIFCLADSYELNNRLALDILSEYFSNELLTLKLPELYLDQCFELSKSNRPADCVRGAYLLTLGINYISEWSGIGCPYYNAIFLLIQQLNQEFTEAQKTKVVGTDSAMYGTILVIRHLYEKLDTDLIEMSTDNWISLMKNIIELCFQIADLILPIVNNASPEGYIPDAALGFSSQTILLCAWRSIKEISLLFGEICSKAQLVPETAGIITVDQVMQIGNFFISTLSETKHRGAFEQASVGFTQLCKRLWGETNEDLRVLPTNWLQNIFDMIQNEDEIENKKFCATRRSAGLPFMVQAIEVTAFEVFKKSFTFDQTMTTLLQMASDSTKSEICTHALNILRALFRHTALGEHCTPFVAEAVVIAIKGSDSKLWGIHNGSSLLFATLMTKIFGVTRTKIFENLSSRNQLSAYTFFTRYPSLYTLLLTQLQSSDLKSGAAKPSLYPMLLLLGRLYPSTYQQAQTQYEILEFINHLDVCSTHNPIYKTRVLAAKALVSFLDKSEVGGYISDQMEEIRKPGHGANFYHGKILQILYILKSLEPKNPVFKQILTTIVTTKWIIPNQNYVFLEVYIEILQILINETHPKEHETFFHTVVTLLTPKLPEIPACGYINFHQTFQKFLFHIDLYYHNSSVEEAVADHIKRGSITDYSVDLILYSIFKDSYLLEDLVDPPYPNSIQIDSVRFQSLLSSEYPKIVKLDVNDVDYRGKLYLILSTMSVAEMQRICDVDSDLELLRFLMITLENETVDNMSYVGACINQVIKSSKDFSQILEDVSNYMFKYSNSSMPYKIRRCMAELIGSTPQMYRDLKLDSPKLKYLCLIWIAIIKLGNDNEEEIRQTIAESMFPNKPIFESIKDDLFDLSCESGIKDEMITYHFYLLYWIFGEADGSNDDDIPDTGLFEKGPENMYFEELYFTKLAAQKLSYSLSTIENRRVTIEDRLTQLKSCEILPFNLSQVEKALDILTGDRIVSELNSLDDHKINIFLEYVNFKKFCQIKENLLNFILQL